MISLSSATWPSATWPSAIWPRSRCKSRSSTRAAPARRRPSGCARARGPWPRRTGRPRRRGGLRCNRFRHRDSRGRGGTADKGKSARSRNSRNRPAPPAPGRRNSGRDISAIWDQGRWVFARRVPFSLSCRICILPRDSGEGGPPEGWWKGRRRRRNFDDDGQAQMRNSFECFSPSKQKI